MSKAVRTRRSGSCATASAALLGKEAAMFLPSGTMCNQVAIATHCRPGDEILAHEDAHIQAAEGGAPGAISGVLIKGLAGERGQFSATTLEEAIRPISRYSPPQRLVEIEQTANKGGGACWPVAAVARGRGGRASARHGGAHGRRAVDECRGGAWCAGVGDRCRLRHGVAGFHQGSGCAVGCGAGGHRPTSSARPGDGSSDWAARCGRAG